MHKRRNSERMEKIVRKKKRLIHLMKSILTMMEKERKKRKKMKMMESIWN